MHINITKTSSRFLFLVLCMSLFSCSGKRPINLGITNSELTLCPATPNCVSSDASDKTHRIKPFHLAIPTSEAWLISKSIIEQFPQTVIVEETPNYLYAECTSRVFGFVDDLEFHLRSEEGIIAVRSASRLGSSDFGVNRKRIEEIRSLLTERGVIKPQ